MRLTALVLATAVGVSGCAHQPPPTTTPTTAPTGQAPAGPEAAAPQGPNKAIVFAAIGAALLIALVASSASHSDPYLDYSDITP